MNKTPQSERKHITFIGKRNAGKSSLINKFLGQELSIVSEIPGTTTDPVKKAMELLPYGPVVLVDTAGLDDSGELGEKRISKSKKAISESDFVIIVIDAQLNEIKPELDLIEELSALNTKFHIVLNKVELEINPKLIENLELFDLPYSKVSCENDLGILELKEKIISLLPKDEEKFLLDGLIDHNDVIVLVMPIDTGAPKGRIILPQVQTLREALNINSISVVCQATELESALAKLKNPPKLVVTDSQAIMQVQKIVPDNVALTTFSILMARYKGDLEELVEGLKALDNLSNGDNVLIAEACSHHAHEDDIGTVKIPNWLKHHTNKNLNIEHFRGRDYPTDLSKFKLIIHCGSCMLTRKAMLARIRRAKIDDVPIVNYGVIISQMHGAIPRALRPFKEAMQLWNNTSFIKNLN